MYPLVVLCTQLLGVRGGPCCGGGDIGRALTAYGLLFGAPDAVEVDMAETQQSIRPTVLSLLTSFPPAEASQL